MKFKRNFLILTLIASLAISITGCGSSDNKTKEKEVETSSQELDTDIAGSNDDTENVDSSDKQSANTNGESKILVAYFTVPETDGVDAVANASRVVDAGEVLGNTQYIAQIIEEYTGGDLFAIETTQEYPGTHKELLDFAYEEKSENERPKLATQIDNLNEYDVIFIGYPNWNADLPMPLYTFFEEYDLSGKTVIPFSTHGGSGFSRTIETITSLQPDAKVIEDGFTVSRNSVSDAKSDVNEWIEELGYSN